MRTKIDHVICGSSRSLSELPDIRNTRFESNQTDNQNVHAYKMVYRSLLI